MNLSKPIFLLIVLLASVNILAQDSPFRFGASAGINISNAMIGSTKTNGSSFRVGYQAGVTVDYALSDEIYILSGLSFIVKGSKIDALDYMFYEEDGRDFTHKFEEQYIRLPLYGAYKMDLSDDMSMMFGVGPYFAYGIGGKSKVNWNQGSFADGRIERKYNTFDDDAILYLDQLKPFDFGVGALVNLEYKKLNANIGYEQGLLNISRDEFYKYWNYCFTLSVGYKY